MSTEKDGKHIHYADQAFIIFNEIMSNNHKDTLERMNRCNKGELFVLHFLIMQEVPVLPSELSMGLQASTARVSALLGSLEKKGQIERNIDRSNRRNILVTITEEGRKRAKIEMEAMKKSMTDVFKDMGEKDTEEFLRLLQQFFFLSQKYRPLQQEKEELF